MKSHALSPFVQLADAYCGAVHLSRARVSTIVLKRGATLDLIAAGQVDITTGTFERAVWWFHENWPDGSAWPDCMVRPTEAPSDHSGDCYLPVAGAGPVSSQARAGSLHPEPPA